MSELVACLHQFPFLVEIVGERKRTHRVGGIDGEKEAAGLMAKWERQASMAAGSGEIRLVLWCLDVDGEDEQLWAGSRHEYQG